MPEPRFLATGTENDCLYHELLLLLGELRLVADEGVGELVHQHRHAGVGRQSVGDLDAPHAVVAQPVEAAELDIGDLVAELVGQDLERAEQRAV